MSSSVRRLPCKTEMACCPGTLVGTSRVWEVELSAAEERDLDRRRKAQKALDREARVRRIKDIVWSAVIASVITIIVVTSLGWLTTQAVVERAREEGAKGLVSLRASICLVRFQQSPD